MGTATTYSTARSPLRRVASCILSDSPHNLSSGGQARQRGAVGITSTDTSWIPRLHCIHMRHTRTYFRLARKPVHTHTNPLFRTLTRYSAR